MLLWIFQLCLSIILIAATVLGLVVAIYLCKGILQLLKTEIESMDNK